jgi:hypothetical protein
MCDVLNVKPSDTMNELLDEYYSAASIGSVQSFCTGLNKLLYRDTELIDSSQFGVVALDREPTKEDLESSTPPLVFVTKRGVLVHKRIVDVVRRITRDNTFRTATLQQDLDREDYLISYPFGFDIDSNSYWTFDRKMWDRYVKQERWVLTDTVTSGQIIHLERLTA